MTELIKYVFYVIAKITVWTVFKIYFRVKSYDRERAPKEGKLIVAANHSSYLDSLALGVDFPRRVHYIMTSVYYKKLILKPFCYLLDTIPIGESLQVSAYKKTIRLLSKGNVVGIFPEGQRSREGVLLDTRKGVGVYALRSKAPIIPVAIAGAREALPPHTIFPKPYRIKLFYGNPLTFPEGTQPEEVSDAIRREIVKLLLDKGYENYVKEEERDSN